MNDEAETKVKIEELEDGSAVFEFPEQKFTIQLKELTWALFEDVDKIQQAEGNDRMRATLHFFNTYVVGGPRAVPLKHTGTAMDAIGAYMSHVNNAQKNSA